MTSYSLLLRTVAGLSGAVHVVSRVDSEGTAVTLCGIRVGDVEQVDRAVDCQMCERMVTPSAYGTD